MPRSDHPQQARPTRSSRPGARSDRRGASSRKAGRGGTLLGLFIGLALGLALAAGIAYWLMKSGNPYQPTTGKDAARETGKTAKSEPAANEKPRFDFYKILPGAEEPKVASKPAERPAPDKATVDRSTAPDKALDKAPDKASERIVNPEQSAPAATGASEKAAKAADRFWLQAGSFSTDSDAENLKARLAFGGWEAQVQPATVADKGVRYRVRLGPYDNTDELNRIKGELARRGFDVAVIKFDRGQ